MRRRIGGTGGRRGSAFAAARAACRKEEGGVEAEVEDDAKCRTKRKRDREKINKFMGLFALGLIVHYSCNTDEPYSYKVMVE